MRRLGVWLLGYWLAVVGVAAFVWVAWTVTEPPNFAAIWLLLAAPTGTLVIMILPGLRDLTDLPFLVGVVVITGLQCWLLYLWLRPSQRSRS